MEPLVDRRRWSPLALAVLLLALASPAAVAPLGTALTYQGVLTVGGVPADGVYDLRFSVWDDEVGGSSLATTTVEDLEVTAGVVGTTLDLGDVYDGGALWLEVAVRDGASTGAFTVVPPRQPLRPLPQALYAFSAGHAAAAGTAAGAGDVAEVDGLDGADLLAFSGLSGVPEDLADGDADLLAGLVCGGGDVVVWDADAWACGPDRGGWRTLTVGSGGDAEANGAALLAAMAMLPTPASVGEGWRVRLEPGRYDLGSGSLVTKPWTVVEGTSESGTVITSSHCTPHEGEGATVVVGSASALAHLTVENTCGGVTDSGVAVRLLATATGASVEDVTVRATGGASYATGLASAGAGTRLHRITASAVGGTSVNVGIVCAASAVITDTTATASGGDLAVGLAVGSLSELAPARVVVSRGSFTGSGASLTQGLVVASADADLGLVTLAGAEGLAITNSFGSHDVHASRMISTGPVSVDRSDGELTVTISQSRVVATGAAITSEGLPVAIRVAATQLLGGAPSTAATCAGVWDESWIFYPATCP